MSNLCRRNAVGPQSIDLRNQCSVQPLTLDATIKTLQLDGDAREASLGARAFRRSVLSIRFTFFKGD